MKKKIKNALVSLKDTLDQNISPHKQKIIGAAATVPIIAVSTMSGACAAGCPYGLVNDPFPGQCSRYIDINGDGICDLSQAVAATTTSTSSTASNTNTHPQNTASTATPSDDSSSTGSSSGGIDIQNGSSDHSNVSTATVQDPSSGVGGATGNEYHILPISLLIIGAYFFTHYLFSKGILKPKTHKRLWNLLLMGGYLGTGTTGVLLIFMVNLGISLAYRQGLAYWHVELALLMVIGTLIHFHIYRKPFKNMFKVLFNFRSGVKKSNKTLEHKTPGTSK